MAIEDTLCIGDFPIEPPFLVDFQLPRLITGGGNKAKQPMSTREFV